jgi:hypothetical protein
MRPSPVSRLILLRAHRLYNGDEIGMTNYLLTDIRQFRRPPAVV